MRHEETKLFYNRIHGTTSGVICATTGFIDIIHRYRNHTSNESTHADLEKVGARIARIEGKAPGNLHVGILELSLLETLEEIDIHESV